MEDDLRRPGARGCPPRTKRAKTLQQTIVEISMSQHMDQFI
jgi:hypothetical protein